MNRIKPFARVLVVDDEGVIRSLLKEVLTGDGFEVDTASDGAEGLKRFQNNPADLVISDTHMPAMDGPAFVRALRSRQPRVPVIVMDSAGADESERDPRPPMARLTKPFALSEVRSAIARLQIIDGGAGRELPMHFDIAG
ncbi:MAG TPA: response regulator [candidate division Zixibacteria bacterium]|jgi:CheY-like chemotaxis protein